MSQAEEWSAVEDDPVALGVSVLNVASEGGIMKIPLSKGLVDYYNQHGHTIPMTAKATLKPDEFKVFIHEVASWVSSHPDWDQKEDIDDIHGIAMEKVIQHRLLLKMKSRSNPDAGKQYDTSFKRVQRMRDNLAARRADRINPRSGGGSQTNNIAVIASEFSPDKVLSLVGNLKVLRAEEDDAFPIIDVSVKEKK
jgi:hypothetical protein